MKDTFTYVEIKLKTLACQKNEQRPMREDKFGERYVQSISHIGS